MENGNKLLTIYRGSERLELAFAGQPVLLDVLRENGISITASCSGDGRCGQCRVYARGDIAPPDQRELAFEGIGGEDGEGFVLRLACRVRLTGEAEIRLPEIAQGHKQGENIPATMTEDIPFGVAVDLGTTTIGVRAVDMSDGRTLAQRSQLNDQRVCGADVMTRIAYCAQENGLDTLTGLIRSQITRMILLMAGERKPEIIVVAGNTVMLHLLAGMDPSYLGQAPYRTKEHFGRWFAARALGLPADCWLMPCIGGYTGGDLTAALLALTSPEGAGKVPREGLALCDLGTNGEMALYTGGHWLTASAAAGPALEGGGISCGSGAAEGAVTAITRADKQGRYFLTSDKDEMTIPVDLRVIGDREPASLTGAAIISLTAILLREGKILPSGRMEQEQWRLNDRVAYTQADVRQLQLAKGAVAAAFYRLCEEHIGRNESSTDNDCLHIDLHITGGLGCRIDLDDAQTIGLTAVPPECRADISFVPDLALEGAALCLRETERRRVLDIAGGAQVLELTGDDRFDCLFVSCMCLGEPDEDY